MKTKTTPVLLGSLILGVVGIQAVLIAHTHKMITGQPLLLGQDHHSLSHLPPLFFSWLSTFFIRPASSSSETTRSLVSMPSLHPPEPAEGWETEAVAPFVTLSDNGNSYIVVMEAPGLSPSNLQVTLSGRDLNLAAWSTPDTGTPMRAQYMEYRIRIPGPVSNKGPPPAEFTGRSRLRLILLKSGSAPAEEPVLSSL